MHSFYKTLSVAGVLLLPLAAGAQATAEPANSAKTTEYFDADGRKQAAAEGADHRVEIVWRDSIPGTHGAGGTVTVFYPSGKPRYVMIYAHVKRRYRVGTTTSFHENGQLRTKEDFVANQREGELLTFYENGKPKRREKYQAGKVLEGACFGPDGATKPCTVYEILPTYGGEVGPAAISKAIMQNVKYPSKALRAQLEGRVFVSFEVDNRGDVQKVRIAKGVADVLDEAAMKGVRALGKFTPGQQDGEPVAVSFTVPVSFSMP